MRLTGVLLDFDGVISKNSVALMQKWVHSYICQFSPAPISERTIRDIAKVTTAFAPRAVLEFFFQSFGIPADVREVQQLMHKEISDSIVIEPEFHKLLHFCSQHNIQVKVLSQRSSAAGAFNQLSHVPGLENSMICSTYGMSKADPTCYKSLSRELQLRLSEWLLVDDSPYALRAAKISDLKTVLMETPTFNMDDYLEYKDLIDLRISSLEDLLQIVEPI